MILISIGIGFIISYLLFILINYSTKIKDNKINNNYRIEYEPHRDRYVVYKGTLLCDLCKTYKEALEKIEYFIERENEIKIEGYE